MTILLLAVAEPGESFCKVQEQDFRISTHVSAAHRGIIINDGRSASERQAPVYRFETLYLQHHEFSCSTRCFSVC